jgi:dolichol-phosphate mannosyltransferase
MSKASLVVVPTFNEAETLARLVAAIHAASPEMRVLVVDDASPDGTGVIARELAARDPRVAVLERPGKAGIGSAYVAGLSWGLARDFERFFEMDADFSHDPKYLSEFVAALDGGADVVVGSRNMPGGTVHGWGILRHLLSKGGSLYSRIILGSSVRDMTTGFKAYTRRALEHIAIETVRSNGYTFQIETTYRALRRGLRVVELPIVFVDRRAGRSKMTRREVLDAVVGVWRLRGS